MRTPEDNPQPRSAAADPVAVRRHLDRILASPEFSSATRLQQFLSYIVEQKINGSDSIKETEIAIEVFHRRSSFDSSGDSVVRVAASNLRSRLRDYYLNTGIRDPITIEVPKGSYVPVFHVRTAAAKPRNRWKVGVAILAILVVSVAAAWTLASRYSHAGWSSIAVLPFLNLSNNPDSAYVAEGFVDEVTTALAQVEGLKVVARSSAFQFQGEGLDVRIAGRRLGVETILEGSLRTVGAKVRVNAQLINVADGFHIWSRTWEGEAAELFAIQDDLARSIAAALRRPGAVRANQPPKQEAYDLYLKGQYFKERRTKADYEKSIAYLKESIRKDPAYAPAHAALAGAYASLAYHQVAPDPQLIDWAKDAASLALRLDDTLAEAHALLAWIRYFYEWDWPESERGLRRALALNPNSARAHDWYAQRVMSEGRFAEALAESSKAVLLDPLNYRLITNHAIVLYCAHRWDEAISQARQALEINPQHFAAHTVIGVSFQEQHKFPEAAAELRAAMSQYSGDADTVAHLAALEMATGDRAGFDKRIALLENPSPNEPPAYYQLAYLYLVSGRRDKAFAALDKSYAQRSSDMPVLNVDPVFDGLHQDPRFIALRKKMGWTK